MEVLSGMAREPLCGFHERETKRKGRRNTGELNEKKKKKKEGGREREREKVRGTRRDKEKMGQVGRI